MSGLKASWLERRRMVLVIPLLCLATVAAAAYVHHRDARHAPVFAILPTSADVAVVQTHHHNCVASDGLAQSKAGGVVWVDRHPTGGRALWLPGANARRCRARLTVLSAGQAADFARAVEQAPPFPPVATSCPMDDGSGVTVYLTYRGRSKAEVVRVGLTGCVSVSAPGRAERELTPLATNALKPFPAAWQ